MRCVICNHGELKPGITSVLFEKDNSTIVIREVPVDICDTSGETYVPDKTAGQIMSLVESVESKKVIVDVRNFSSENSATC